MSDHTAPSTRKLFLLLRAAVSRSAYILQMIKRTFQNIPEGHLSEADQQSFLMHLGWSRGMTWEDLLQSRRVLIISEAGAGKTHECSNQAERLWKAGEPAFFIDLAALAKEDLRDLLDSDEEARFDSWLSSQSEMGTFFLDSIDELRLTLGSFKRAIQRLKKAIASQLHRSRVVITTRPIPIDEQLIRRFLPIPPTSPSEPSEETFAKIAMNEHHGSNNGEDKPGSAPDWRIVALMPLSDAQILEFAGGQGIDEPELFLADLKRRNALEFARRPQDLIELCADWRQHKRIRTHSDQVATNIRIKLLPRDDRPEPAELSVDKALEGASRLALALQVTRRLTIRHHAASDDISDNAAVDPATVLSDWNPGERMALLERPLFKFASYGRVRFHHQSVPEYLAAQRLLELRRCRMSFRALKRLLFAETRGEVIVRPSRRPIAGWMALWEPGVFELLRENEPTVLLDEGDPESLTQAQRSRALRAYATRYGPGGWRGLQVPRIQIHRFASPELADEVRRIWKGRVENPDVREILLALIEAGAIGECADIAQEVACDANASWIERMIALDALVAMDGEVLNRISAEVAAANPVWSDRAASGAVLRLFPKHMSIQQLCQTLAWVKDEGRGVGDLSWQLPRLIASAKLSFLELENLRDALVTLISYGLAWREQSPHFTSERDHLSGALAAICARGLNTSTSDPWLRASVLALRLHHTDHHDDNPIKAIRSRLTKLRAEENERLFWVEDDLVRSLSTTEHPWKRLARITIHDGVVELRADRDLKWVKGGLSDGRRDPSDRAMLLEAAIRMPLEREHWRQHVENLKPLVTDANTLVERIDEQLRPTGHDRDHRRWEKREANRRRQIERRNAKDRASWVQFWREVAYQRDAAFSAKKAWNTAWNLWRAMRHDGADSRSAGWNRRFIEEQFDKDTADHLRQILMGIWRKDRPTLARERPDAERSTLLVRWQLGLAALYAEAEDPEWSTKLVDDEARLAARYAPIELNGLPPWMESLSKTHPDAVDATLGEELCWELNQAPDGHGHSSLLQAIEYSPECVARIFLPRLRSWLNAGGDCVKEANIAALATRIAQVCRVIVKHGDDEALSHLLRLAEGRMAGDLPAELVHVWLPTLMRLDPALGVSALESHISTVKPGKQTEAVAWFASLIGDRRDSVSLYDERFTPRLLLRLLRLAYRHVRHEDDVRHRGSYSPDTRDYAERARNEIVAALLKATGEEGWNAKLEMAADPLCAHFRDRIRAVAEENWAQEIDTVVFDEQQAVALDRAGEAPAPTSEAMFAVMKDRLSDLDSLMLRDDSPREAWAGINDEKVMRRELARELNHAANGIYRIDQEAVTADEKETDIRLLSMVSEHEAVVELKLGDERSARDLRDTIGQQLVKKYMASENCRSGALLVTLAKNRKWMHPENRKFIGPDELLDLLRDEAERIQEDLGGAVGLYVHLLDLRPRLLPEMDAKGKGPKP